MPDDQNLIVRIREAFPRTGTIDDVRSYGDTLYVPVAFTDPAASAEIRDENGHEYYVTSRPRVHEEDFRCFTLSEAIPVGVKFSGTVTVFGKEHEFKGVSVELEPRLVEQRTKLLTATGIETVPTTMTVSKEIRRIREYFPRTGIIDDVLSFGDTLYIPVAFRDPNASVVVNDENGHEYAVTSGPSIHEEGFRYFTLTEKIPVGVRFSGSVTVLGKAHEFCGIAVESEPHLAEATDNGEEVASAPLEHSSSKHLTIALVLLLVMVGAIAATLFLLKDSKGISSILSRFSNKTDNTITITLTSSSLQVTGTVGKNLESIDLSSYVTVSDGGNPLFSARGVLPDGVSLENSGLLSGTPFERFNGQVPVTVSYSDAKSKTITLDFTINKSDAMGIQDENKPPKPVPEISIVETPKTIKGTVGRPISDIFLSDFVKVSDGGTPSFSALDVPSGLFLHEGVINGKPSTSGEYSIFVTVEYKEAMAKTIRINFSIDDSPQVKDEPSNATFELTEHSITIKGKVGTPIEKVKLSDYARVSNGATLDFSPETPGDKLPEGLNLTHDGLIYGTPSTPTDPSKIFSFIKKIKVSCKNQNDYQIMSIFFQIESKPTRPRRTYTVKSGDSLYKIAKIYNISRQDLAEENNITPQDPLNVGQVLLLPDSAAETPQPLKPRLPKAPKRPEYPRLYTATISENGTYMICDEADVISLNHIQGEEGITLVFCPDRLNWKINQSRYNDIWGQMCNSSKLNSRQINKILVIEPDKQFSPGLKTPQDKRVKNSIPVNIMELK